MINTFLVFLILTTCLHIGLRCIFYKKISIPRQTPSGMAVRAELRTYRLIYQLAIALIAILLGGMMLFPVSFPEWLVIGIYCSLFVLFFIALLFMGLSVGIECDKLFNSSRENEEKP